MACVVFSYSLTGILENKGIDSEDTKERKEGVF
jgi:hypothetical protein